MSEDDVTAKEALHVAQRALAKCVEADRRLDDIEAELEATRDAVDSHLQEVETDE
jgi:predicted transcriptional regulator